MAENLVQAMEDLYKTMLHMCGDQTLDVKFAPEGGHILPPGLIAVLEVRKTPAAIDLIRRIPYFGWSQHVLPNSEAINYLRLRLGEFPCAWRPVKYGNMNNEAHLSSDSLGDSIVKPCEVPVITYDDEVGKVFVIDTETWTARLWDYYQLDNSGNCPLHPDECPPMCVERTRRVPEPRPAVDFFREWRQKYLDLKWMLDCRDSPVIWGDDDEDWFMITQQIFRDHGWPDDYRGIECQKAMETAPGPLDDTNVYSDTDEEGESDGHRQT